MLLLISSMSNILSARDHMHVEYCGIFGLDRGAQGSEPKYSKCKNATMIGKSSITIKILIGNQSSITIAYNSMRIYIRYFNRYVSWSPLSQNHTQNVSKCNTLPEGSAVNSGDWTIEPSKNIAFCHNYVYDFQWMIYFVGWNPGSFAAVLKNSKNCPFNQFCNDISSSAS